jgi:hypothetical protein
MLHLGTHVNIQKLIDAACFYDARKKGV